MASFNFNLGKFDFKSVSEIWQLPTRESTNFGGRYFCRLRRVLGEIKNVRDKCRRKLLGIRKEGCDETSWSGPKGGKHGMMWGLMMASENWNLFDLIENGEFSFLLLFPFWGLSFSLLIIRVNDDGRSISSLIAGFTSLILPRKSLIALENTSLVWCFTHLHFFIYIYTQYELPLSACPTSTYLTHWLQWAGNKALSWNEVILICLFLCSSSMIPWRP